MSGEQRAWAFALSVSLAFHGALFFLAQEPAARELPKPPIAVRLIRADSGGTGPAPLAEAARAKAEQKAAQRDTAKKEIKHEKKTAEKFLEKPVKKPAKKPVNKPVKKTETAPLKTAGTPKAEPAGAEAVKAGAPDGPAGVAAPACGRSAAPAKGAGNGGIADARALRTLKKTAPEYPPFSRKRREEGTVTLIITITGGSVSDVEIETSSGHARLDASAAKALKLWKFDCKETVRARIPVTFKLK